MALNIVLAPDLQHFAFSSAVSPLQSPQQLALTEGDFPIPPKPCSYNQAGPTPLREEFPLLLGIFSYCHSKVGRKEPQ